MVTLKLGSVGADVKLLQLSLKLTADGVFGSKTEQAVKEFLKKQKITVDGIVGTITWEKLGYVTNRKITEIILHCSATPEGKDYSVDTIRKWHLDKGFGDIGYHYIIYRDGSIHKGRDLAKIGAHTIGHNTNSIGICYIGGCDTNGKPKDTRTLLLKQALVKLVKELMTKYNISNKNVHCHYEFAKKACPSFKIDDFRDELR